MALTFWAGDRWKPASFARREAGADVYLCCPGPSLADVDPAALQVPGALTIAVNSAYPHIRRPDFWIGTDHPACFDKTLLWATFPKILRAAWREQLIFGVPIKACPQTYFADARHDLHPLDMWRWQNRLDNLCLVTRMWNSFDAALHFALWLGAKRIHLVGCDFGGAKDYYDDRVLTDSHRNANRQLYQEQVHMLAHHALEGAMHHQVEFVSCTPRSPVNAFMRSLPLAQALCGTAQRVPLAWTPRPNAQDAALCRWRGEQRGENGVVVGVIEEQAWMLKWWYANFRKHNPEIPVAFADFGVSSQHQTWMREHGFRIEVKAPTSVAGWFRKPFAILAAPFQRVMWLDLDTEIRGSLGHLFPLCHGGKVAACRTDVMTPESYARQRDRGWCVMSPPPHYDGGLIIMERGNPAIEEWALNSIPPHEFTYRGDHEILNVVLSRRGVAADVGAADFGLSRNPTDKTATILHYCGMPAKAKLRHQLAGTATVPPPPLGGSLMEPAETARLIHALQELCDGRDTVGILEIGVASGGTAMTMMRAVVDKGKRFQYVGVDPLRWQVPVFGCGFESHGTIHMVQEASSDAVPSVRTIAKEGFDLVLIDGCHCERCAEGDRQRFAPMVRQGGYLAYHDVLQPTDATSRQPGSDHVGHGVRPAYERALAEDGWEDAGVVGERLGLALLRRVAPVMATSAAQAGEVSSDAL